MGWVFTSLWTLALCYRVFGADSCANSLMQVFLFQAQFMLTMLALVLSRNKNDSENFIYIAPSNT